MNADNLEEILSESKGNQREQISFNRDKIVSHLPYGLIQRDKRYVEDYIIKALENYSNQLERGDSNDLDL